MVALTAVLVVRGGSDAGAPTPDLEFPQGYWQAVPRDFIEAIDDPSFVSASDVEWPDNADVIGVEINGDARAYPISTLISREMVIDEIGGVPVLVTWCPICATALVHERTIDGEAAIFGVQGGLYRNAMTWYDHATGSIWSQPFGEAIAGPLAGEVLPLRSSMLTTWGVWRDRHPETLALDSTGQATGFDLANLLLVVTIDDETRGYPVRAAGGFGVVNERVGSVSLAVVVDPGNTNRWAVFDRTVDGAVVKLELEGADLRDTTSDRTFDPFTGVARDGGEGLTALPAITVDPGFGPTRTAKFATLWPEATVWWPPRDDR